MTANVVDARAILDRHLAPLLEHGTDPASFGPGARLREEMGLTSLESVSLLMSLEEEFDVEITDEEISKLQTLGDLLELMTSKIDSTPPV